MATPYNVREAGPARGGEAVVVATPFSRVSRALYVGVGGDVTVEFSDGSTVEFVGVPAGTVLPVAAVEVTAATATDMVALF